MNDPLLRSQYHEKRREERERSEAYKNTSSSNNYGNKNYGSERYVAPDYKKLREEKEAKERKEFEQLMNNGTSYKTSESMFYDGKHMVRLISETCVTVDYPPKYYVDGIDFAEENLKFALIFGQKEAAYYLFHIYSKGILKRKQNKPLSRIILHIGILLGEQLCIDIIKKEKPINEKDLVLIAQKCVVEIKENKEIFLDNTEILPDTKKDVLKAFNNAIGNFGHEPLIVENNLEQPVVWKESNNKNSNGTNGINNKTSDIKVGGKVFGTITESTINYNRNYFINEANVVVVKFRSITFPENINSGEFIKLSYALTFPNGNAIYETDPAYLVIEYNKQGRLHFMNLPNIPVVSNDYNEPVLINYHGNIYVLPVSSGEYNKLVQCINSNNGKIVFDNIDKKELVVVPLNFNVSNNISQSSSQCCDFCYVY